MEGHGGLLSGSRPLVDRNNLNFLTLKQLSQGDPTIKLIDLGITSLSQEAIEPLLPVERLSLQKNALTSLPQGFDRLKKLRYLDLHDNKLQEIPSALLNCPQLEILDLSMNSIEHLPHEYPQVWCENLKVLSLENNNLASLRELYPAVMSLRNLKILEIGGNQIPQEELDQVEALTQGSSPSRSESPGEYWCVALKKYFLETKLNRAAKRMGFINVSEGERQQDELYNHSRYNDYFKRLSVLPEETNSQRVTHDEIVVACRKLLFSFTECQQNIRKITSFCEEKAVAIQCISLLYSVRSHIDNLVEILEQSDSPTTANNAVMIKLCLTIVPVFKQIFSILRKNYDSFFRENDISFVRVFYMNLLCCYSEMYNTWNQLAPAEAFSNRKKRSIKSQNVVLPFKHGLARTRSNTIQRSQNSASQSNTRPASPSASYSNPASVSSTPPPAQNISMVEARVGDGSPRQKVDTHQNSPRLARRAPEIHAFTGASAPSAPPNAMSQADSAANATEESQVPDPDVDKQLYQTLGTVIGMVNVVYSQLTAAITKSAIASTKSGELSNITSLVAAKIKDLTDTCFQSMELSKTLKERLMDISRSGDDVFSSVLEKRKTWEDINAFLKSIISILANTKIIMKDLPILSEVRPNLASLAKITKDVTVILELSSYRTVSQSQQPSQTTQAVQTQQPPPPLPQQQQSLQHTPLPQQAQQQSNQMGHEPQNSKPASFHYQSTQEEPHASVLVTPLSTPSLVTTHSTNPFDNY
ncbi:LAMI_0F05754g1_1 [Lachancea mirantina]|uniref:LAMI_0F05754g1_1 n=1 Tax=Lachancea mirantina TaxID=1230905 RepID=A0A1G4JYH1_9SACH|nr:LAMI_0F05754g1_1 [Lachancea mirantina]